MTKQQLIDLIAQLPDQDYSLEELQYHLYARAKIEKGLRQSEAGETIPAEEMRVRVARWLGE